MFGKDKNKITRSNEHGFIDSMVFCTNQMIKKKKEWDFSHIIKLIYSVLKCNIFLHFPDKKEAYGLIEES
jgi:hypothetical protein